MENKTISAIKGRIELESARNVRDLGGYPCVQGGVTSAVFLRGDSTRLLSENDKIRLIGLGLSHVIDLRRTSEIEKVPSAFGGDERVAYTQLPFFPEDSERQLGKLEADFSMGKLYIAMVQNFGESLKAIFSKLAADWQGRMLFHCTAGKDRTGVVAALLLYLVGVSPEIIVQDYVLTAELLVDRMDELRSVSIDPRIPAPIADEMLGVRAENMQLFLDFLKDSYGGAQAYLLSIGMQQAEIDSLKEKMILKGEVHESD